MGYFLWLKIWKIKLIIATINLQNSNKVEYVIMLSPPFFLKLLRSMPKSILNTILSFWLHFTYVAIYKNVKRFWWILYFSNSSFLGSRSPRSWLRIYTADKIFSRILLYISRLIGCICSYMSAFRGVCLPVYAGQ